jgi:hypothetical protein
MVGCVGHGARAGLRPLECIGVSGSSCAGE